jgi:hypothetical protein
VKKKKEKKKKENIAFSFEAGKRGVRISKTDLVMVGGSASH